jgi:hypothetical protein
VQTVTMTSLDCQIDNLPHPSREKKSKEPPKYLLKEIIRIHD